MKKVVGKGGVWGCGVVINPLGKQVTFVKKKLRIFFRVRLKYGG